MDWSKAKTILIVSFIIVNVLLVLALVNTNESVETLVSDEFVEDSLRLLSNKDISVATEIPREIPSLETLTVEYETFNTQELNHKFFDGNGRISIKGDGFVEIQTGDDKLTLLNNKLLIYESDKGANPKVLYNNDDAIQVASHYLGDLDFELSDMKLSHIKESEGRYYLEFSKVYNEKYLESSFTNIQLDDMGIRKLERQWLNVIEVGNTPIFISSAPKSILGLLSMNEVYGKAVKDISLSYYFEPEKHEYIQNPSAAKQGKTIPAWRIQFEDGYKVFIDNY